MSAPTFVAFQPLVSRIPNRTLRKRIEALSLGADVEQLRRRRQPTDCIHRVMDTDCKNRSLCKLSTLHDTVRRICNRPFHRSVIHEFNVNYFPTPPFLPLKRPLTLRTQATWEECLGQFRLAILVYIRSRSSSLSPWMTLAQGKLPYLVV